MRLAWFSPMPPVRSGIAACSAELVVALAAEHHIDVYVDAGPPSTAFRPAAGMSSAHEFVWRHARHPYDLTVYQVGNSSNHDYLWPYLFRYPGLAVLHDAHLHHARAAALLRVKRADDYRAEFAANHPDLAPALAELAVRGFDSHLYYLAPMTRLIALASRTTAVHTAALAAELRDAAPGAAVEIITLGHGRLLDPASVQAARVSVRRRHGIPDEAVVFGVFGGLTPEKRVPQVLDAFGALLPYAPAAHLVLAGAEARHYDVRADVQARGLAARTTLTGYIESEEALGELIASTDVALNLRWPTAREVSGPWLRALAAGVPTVTIDLSHMSHVPALDPRTWQPHGGGAQAPAVTVAIDILDEAHSLRLAMRRLASDGALRQAIAEAGRKYWIAEHSIDRMLGDYRRVLAGAAARPAPRVDLPPHLRPDGDATLRGILAHTGITAPIWSTL